jgi:Na+/H+ antiporter NhaC
MESLIEHAGILSIVPPLVAIGLALITKQVILSLLIGIMSGSFIYSILAGFGPLGIFTVTIDIMIAKLADSDNAAMIIFLAILGALLALITKAGGSAAYGAWATKRIKSQRSAGLLTAGLGLLIFIDDYFNCLTVGTVMRPVTDRYRISREKLAYLIDSTAAPICIIAPISSWAASVISYYPTDAGVSGMQAFISAIPMNLYALLSIFMLFWLVIRKNNDFGPMAIAQRKADENGVTDNVAILSAGETDELAALSVSSKGKVYDLIVPVAFLVVFSIFAMIFYGGYWDGEGKSLFDAFGDTAAGFALALGGFCSLIVAFLLYIPRKIINFKEFFTCIGTGIKSMVPALIILTLAWTISGVCRDLLSTGTYVAILVETYSLPVILLPAIIFIISAALSFSTGTSWGTFGILIPIVISICNVVAPHLSVISLSAVLAGSVFGDHCSPISDTTILSSIGARCNHMDHVTTQIPYAVLVALVCFIGYIIAGIVAPAGSAISATLSSAAISLPVSLALLITALIIIPKVWNKKNPA